MTTQVSPIDAATIAYQQNRSLSKAHQASFRTGYVARERGRSMEACPYTEVGHRTAWFDGWRAAEADAESLASAKSPAKKKEPWKDPDRLEIVPVGKKGWEIELWTRGSLKMVGVENYRSKAAARKGAHRLRKSMVVSFTLAIWDGPKRLTA